MRTLFGVGSVGGSGGGGYVGGGRGSWVVVPKVEYEEVGMVGVPVPVPGKPVPGTDVELPDEMLLVEVEELETEVSVSVLEVIGTEGVDPVLRAVKLPGGMKVVEKDTTVLVLTVVFPGSVHVVVKTVVKLKVDIVPVSVLVLELVELEVGTGRVLLNPVPEE